ncbi:MAG: hypothetical protein IKU07_08105 [Oscillospiraceae bacterium]|nr:hypothetical protein [Oscillospiraceae bacterium]
MKKLICLLLLLFLLVGCGAVPENAPQTTAATSNTQNKDLLPEALLGKSPRELMALFGNDYREVVPEGDPPYFYFEGASPYQFCGSIEDEAIFYLKGQEAGSSILPGLTVGSTVEALEAWAENTDRIYTPADSWYETAGVEYGWAFITGSGYNYSLYIKDRVIFSFECWMETE